MLRQTEIASLSVMQDSQRPRSPAVDTPNLRSADLRVRENDDEVWGVERKATRTVVPLSETKHTCSAQFMVAHRWRIDTSWSRS